MRLPSRANKPLGFAGEQAAADFLQQQGYRVVATNFYARHGEIDIIAEDQNTRIFVEVKTRSREYFASSCVITYKKQQSIIKAALEYNYKTKWPRNKNTRFDVALVNPIGVSFAIRYIPNAFSVTTEAII
ncbi:TPA: YraN family protein [Candidatus Dependentiae bacterium]|nr:MAG: YraN family protein [Lentisphaerae bacterium GWF2_44_16]HAU30204.1 YraN family protein [Candidatus Dependentiae bacterium]